MGRAGGESLGDDPDDRDSRGSGASRSATGRVSLFRCAAPDAIAREFREAGLRDVVETDVRATLDPENAEDYWDYITEVTAPVVVGLDLADAGGRARIRATVLDEVRTFEVDGKPRIPTHARCIAGTK
ncbi:MAG: hypothetical protein QOC79_82 [Actinomycetota bacterium]|nr:hypothetical protein [Actinomycetota bacterium]